MSDKIPLDPQHLTLRDLKRARAGPLEGRDPMEALTDPIDRVALVGWCVRSRDDPEFTWADAEDLTLDAFAWGAEEDGDEPPLTDSNDGPGEPDAMPKPKRSPARPPAPAPSTSSDPSSASPKTNSST